jgi:hypothetical protein
VTAAAAEARLSESRIRAGGVPALVVLLLALHVFLALSAISGRGFSIDEGDHLTEGYNEWVTHDYRGVNIANGDLIHRWASLPLLVTRPRFLGGPADAFWRSADYFKLGREFLFESGNEADWMLFLGRCMAVLLSAALGLIVFIASRGLFGPVGGLLSLLLYALCPVILAHAAMVTTDMSLSLTLSASAFLVWKLLHRITWGTLLLSAGVAGLLFLAKLTAVLILPVALVLVVLRLAGNEPLSVELFPVPRVLSRRSSQFLAAAGLFSFHAAAAVAIVWANFEFRFAGSSIPSDTSLAWTPAPSDPRALTPIVQESFDFIQAHRLLPEAYVRGANTMLLFNQKRLAFMHGRWSYAGWRTFFPYAFAIKTPLALFAILAIAACCWMRNPGRRSLLYRSAPWWALIAVVMTAASLQHVDIGHRHILAVYPALYVLSGAAALGISGRRWPRFATGAAVACFAATSFYARPDYLAYVNFLGGGMANGYRDLTDGSEDWGLGLPQLRRWLDVHDPGNAVPVFLGYRGRDLPEYRGIACQSLYTGIGADSRVLGLSAGYYAISASVLEGVTYADGPWNSGYEASYRNVTKLINYASGLPPPERRKAYERLYAPFVELRLARLCAWLRRPETRPPDAFVGHAILVWRLTDKDVADALTGPVPADDAQWASFQQSLHG